MKKIFLLMALLVSGCASASPIDIAIPTAKPSIATTEYLGHLAPKGYANGLYHSLIDTKIESALVPVRKMELQGLHMAAKGETDVIEAIGSKFSNGIWGGATALLIAAGYMTPRPQEKSKISEALNADPPEKS